MGHRLVAVDQGEKYAGGKRAEDRFETHAVGQRRKTDQQHERRSDSDLCRRVLKPLEHAPETHRALEAGDREADQEHDHAEHPEKDQRSGRAGRALPREEQRQQDDDPNSATDAAAITSWPKLLVILPESLSTGKITPSEVATSTIATNSGDSTNPPALSPSPR